VLSSVSEKFLVYASNFQLALNRPCSQVTQAPSSAIDEGHFLHF